MLARSEERDPLTQTPLSITMNPLRDRTIEHTANVFIAQMRDGNCRQLLVAWEKDYRKKRADFLCTSEYTHIRGSPKSLHKPHIWRSNYRYCCWPRVLACALMRFTASSRSAGRSCGRKAHASGCSFLLSSLSSSRSR